MATQAQTVRIERLQEEIEAISENILKTEREICTQSSAMPWERVLEMKAHLYDLGKARASRMQDLQRLTTPEPQQSEIFK